MIPDRSSLSPLRWWVLVALFLSMTINLLDRQVLSLVAPVVRDELHLSNTDYGVILFCFLLGLTLGQIPVGMMMDRFGPRRGFIAVVSGWSIVSVLHGLAGSMAQFAGLRFLLGLNECGTYSGGVKVIGRWFPQRERAFASGLFNSGSIVGAVIAPPLIVLLMKRYGWPAAFFVPSVIGALWLVPWMLWYRDENRQPEVAATPVKSSATQPTVRALLGLAPVWGVVLMRAFGGPVTHFYWYWLPEYLKRERGMSLEAIGMFAWMPFFCGGLGNIGGGWLSSHLIQRGWSVDRARKTVIAIATVLCLLAVLVPFARQASVALGFICLASLGINAIAANLMGLIADLFPESVLSRVSALTGVGDGTVSMIMMLVTGVVVDHASFLPVFIAAGVLPVLSLASLLVLVGKVRPIPVLPSELACPAVAAG